MQRKTNKSTIIIEDFNTFLQDQMSHQANKKQVQMQEEISTLTVLAGETSTNEGRNWACHHHTVLAEKAKSFQILGHRE